MTKLLKIYYQSCRDIAQVFNKKYFDGEADMYDIGGEVDGVWGVNDFYFDIQSMAQALQLKLTIDELMSWYDQWTDTDESKIKVNMKNWKYLVNQKL
jgi:hypothetical protein